MANDLLTSLLNEASTNWGMDKLNIQDAMARIAFHESKNDPTAIQISDKSSTGYGPGRGMYQYEIGDEQGAHSAINRLISFNKASGGKYDISFLDSLIKNKTYDFSTLTAEQQDILFLADKLGDKTANMGTYDFNNDGILSNEELSEFHADEHWAGYEGVEDFIFNLKGGIGPRKSSNPPNITKRHLFTDKASKDYQFYKP
tara:strand:+ start:241 stop:843 length:603 start_codon:yes stop_codon:yes gene_type:complete